MRPSRWTDRQLAQRIALGDQDACAVLVRTHHAKIYGFLACLCRDAHLAEDLTQETFLACWRKIGEFRSESSLAGWLHGIAYRKFVDTVRGARAKALKASDEGLTLWAAPGTSPLERLAQDETSARLAQAVSELEDLERAIITMHYFESMSISEVAAALGSPAGTVKWRLSKALEQIRRNMERHHHEHFGEDAGRAGAVRAGD